MKRLLLTCALALSLGALARAENIIVTVRNPAKPLGDDVDGAIVDESPGGITIKDKAGTRKIPSLEILSVVYITDKAERSKFRSPDQAEAAALKQRDAKDRKKGLEIAKRGFDALAVDVAGNERAMRYAAYRSARALAHLSKDDPAERKKALAALNDYRKTYPDGWEVLPVLRLLSEMQEEDKDVNGAAETWEQLANLRDMPPETRINSSIMVAQIFLRANRHADAEKKLETALGLISKEDPNYAKLQLYLSKARLAQKKTTNLETMLRETIQANGEAETRAIAYNLLGDYYTLKADQATAKEEKDKALEEAFWSYLRVHTLYAATPEEDAKALYHLWKLFPIVPGGDPVKGRECYNRLMEKEFKDTEFQALAKKEMP